jgi:hypothetical protein
MVPFATYMKRKTKNLGVDITESGAPKKEIISCYFRSPTRKYTKTPILLSRAVFLCAIAA